MVSNLTDKKIGIVVNLYHPIIGGAETHTKQLSACLREIGIPVSIITRKNLGYPKQDSIDGCDVYRILEFWNLHNHTCSKIYKVVKRKLWPNTNKDYVNSTLGKSMEIDRQKPCLIDRIAVKYSLMGIKIPLLIHSITHHYDLLQFQLLSTFEMFPAFPYWLRHKKKILRLGAMKDFYEIEKANKMSHFRQIVIKEFEKIVCISSALKHKWLNIGVSPDKLVEIPNGVDIDRFKPTTMESKKRLRYDLGLPHKKLIVSIAKQVAIKGIKLTLEAILMAKQTIPDIHYVHVGGQGETTGRLERYIKENKLESYVSFVGEKTDVAPYLQCADLFVSSSYTEGLSNAMLEALASGLPLVVTDTSGAIDAVVPGENGYVLKDRDERSLSIYLVNLLQNNDKRRRFGKASRNIAVSKFSLKEMVKKYTTMYSEVLAV